MKRVKVITGVVIILVVIIILVSILTLNWINDYNKSIERANFDKSIKELGAYNDTFDINKIQVSMMGENYVELYRFSKGGKGEQKNIIEITNNNKETIWIEYYCDTSLNYLYEQPNVWLTQCSPDQYHYGLEVIQPNSKKTMEIGMLAHSNSDMEGEYNAVINIVLKKYSIDNKAGATKYVERSDNLKSYPITIKINR